MKARDNIFVWFALALAGAIALYFTVVISFWIAYDGKFYPKTYISGVNVGGKTKEEAKGLLEAKIAEYKKSEITFVGSRTSNKVAAGELEPVFDVTGTIDTAMAEERNRPTALGAKQEFSVSASYNAEKLYSKLKELEKKVETSPMEASIEIKDGELAYSPGKDGIKLNFGATEENFVNTLSGLGAKSQISEIVIPPLLSEKEFEDQKTALGDLTEQKLTLVYGTARYPVTSKEILSWISLGSPDSVLAYRFGDDPLFKPFWGGSDSGKFSQLAVSNHLKTIAGKINTTPVSAKLAGANGVVTVYVPEKNGKTLDVPKSVDAVMDALEDDKELADLVVSTEKAEVRSDNLAELGLTGLLSTGYSNFSGSPANRRHNIQTGASKFNGVLIKPDQDFSFNTALGPVDASTGYLPELVILENKTTPQFGGGMCQVSSTAFRAALNAGLPILERTAHAYPVVYYKPYGVDATIYLPKPDLVFKNDTGKYILIQTRIEGNNLYFDFYGTKLVRTIAFGGNENGAGAVNPVEKVTPLLTEQGARGNGSFTATFWRFIYDSTGKLVKSTKFTSKYDSPDKYPH